MDVAVDQTGHDRGARQLDQPVGLRRLARAHALDVTVVDDEPLARAGVTQRMHTRGTVEGLHGDAMMACDRAGTREADRADPSEPTAWLANRLPVVRLEAEAGERPPPCIERPLGAQPVPPHEHDVVHPPDRHGVGLHDRAIGEAEHGVRDDGGGRRPDREAAHPGVFETSEEA